MYRDIIKNGQILAKWRNDEERRALSQMYLDYYRGVYKDILSDIIDEQIKNSRSGVNLKHFMESEGTTEWLINEIALVFAEPCEIKPNINDKKILEKFHQFLENLDIHIILENVNQLVELLKDVAVVPIVQNGKLSLKIITPEKCFVNQNQEDPTKADRFFYQIGIYQDTPGIATPVDAYMCYDITSGILKAYKCRMMENGEVDKDSIEYVNVPNYKQIPVTIFRDYLPDDSFWYQGNSSIVDKSIAIDMRRTDLAMGEAYHIPMKVFKGGSKKDFENMILDRTTVHHIPNDDNGNPGDAEILTPQDDLKELLDLIQARRKTLARNAGLSSDTIDGVTATSGYQLELSEMNIININKRKRKYYTRPIKEMINLAIETAIYYNLIDFTMIKDIKVDYGEIIFAQSEEEKARTRAMKIQEGIWSPIMSLMEDNPELDEKAAEELLLKIKKQNDMIKPENPFDEKKINNA